MAFAIVGAVVASKRPRNPLGWLLVAVCLGQYLAGAGDMYGRYAMVTRQGALPVGGLAMWLGTIAWPLGTACLLVFVPLLFPTGRPPTRRWWWVGWLGGVATAFVIVPGAVATWPHRGLLHDGERAEAAAGDSLLLDLGDAGFPLLLVAGGCAAVSLLVRFARSRGEERAQLKWLVYAVVVTVAFVTASEQLPLPDWFDLVFIPVAIPSAALAVGVAILRYRLYDIDRIISRTVSYGVLTGLLLAVYLAVVFALQQLLSPIAGESQLAVAGGTLLVAALFQPARRRVQTAVDRRFNRARYDAQRTIDAFRVRLRDETDLEQLDAELVGAVRSTVQPEQVSLWLRPSDTEAHS